jgi:SPP1 gp7 family putative phage head morphogenesis protein
MFFSKPLTEDAAEKAFAERAAMPSRQFYALVGELRSTAWTVSALTNMKMMLRVKRMLQAVIAAGGDHKTFENLLKSQGVLWSRAYTQLVYRMAANQAYSAARHRVMNDRAVQSSHPWIMYDAINDQHVRPTHLKWDGKAWRREEFPRYLTPPNDYNCRCEIRMLTEEQVTNAGAQKQSKSPDPKKVDIGFKYNPHDRYETRMQATLRAARNLLGS